MIPLKKILCPTDFSEYSYEALKVANELALEFSAELYLVHVITPIPILAEHIGPSAFNIKLYEQMLEENAKEMLTKLVDTRVPEKLKVQSIVGHGDAAGEIVKIAEEIEKVDLIVIATHGKTGKFQFFFGSVAERIVRFSSTPVLTIRVKQKKK